MGRGYLYMLLRDVQANTAMSFKRKLCSYENIHCSIADSSKRLKTTEMSIKRGPVKSWTTN